MQVVKLLVYSPSFAKVVGLAVGALNCSSLGGAGLWRRHKTEEVLCAPLINDVAPVILV